MFLINNSNHLFVSTYNSDEFLLSSEKMEMKFECLDENCNSDFSILRRFYSIDLFYGPDGFSMTVNWQNPYRKELLEVKLPSIIILPGLKAMFDTSQLILQQQSSGQPLLPGRLPAIKKWISYRNLIWLRTSREEHHVHFEALRSVNSFWEAQILAAGNEEELPFKIIIASGETKIFIIPPLVPLFLHILYSLSDYIRISEDMKLLEWYWGENERWRSEG